MSMVIGAPIAVPASVAGAIWPNRLLECRLSAFAAVGIAIPTFVIGIVADHQLSGSSSAGCRRRATSRSTATRSTASSRRCSLRSRSASGSPPRRCGSCGLAARGRLRVVRQHGDGEGPASRRKVVVRHELPNASIPAITAAGIIVAHLVGGAVIVEYVFARPGPRLAARRLGLPARLRRAAVARPARGRRLHRHEPGRRRDPRLRRPAAAHEGRVT